MSPFVLIFAAALSAGFLGAMLGLGGGMILVPLLTLFVGLPIHTVVATSLLAIIVTSSVATTTYCRTDQTNVRLGILLETVTALGAVAGGLIGSNLAPGTLKIIFGVVALYTAYSLVIKRSQQSTEALKASGTDRLSAFWHITGVYREKPTEPAEAYSVQNMPAGLAISFVAGNIAAMLGVGGGVIKVPIMNLVMKVPLKAAMATSTFMVGITASVTAIIYYLHGFVDLTIVAPAVFGVLIGARSGALTAQKARTGSLRILLGLILAVLAVQMIMAAF